MDLYGESHACHHAGDYSESLVLNGRVQGYIEARRRLMVLLEPYLEDDDETDDGLLIDDEEA
jgi:hypothetical protein